MTHVDLDGYDVSHIECEILLMRTYLGIHALIQVVGLVTIDRCYGSDHTVSLLMFIMILFGCLVSVINVMYIIRCKGHIKTHDVIVCLYLLKSFEEISSGHVMAFVPPTMHGMKM